MNPTDILLAIALLLILMLLFYLLHMLVKAFREGWKTRKSPPRPMRRASSA